MLQASRLEYLQVAPILGVSTNAANSKVSVKHVKKLYNFKSPKICHKNCRNCINWTSDLCLDSNFGGDDPIFGTSPKCGGRRREHNVRGRQHPRPIGYNALEYHHLEFLWMEFSWLLRGRS